MGLGGVGAILLLNPIDDETGEASKDKDAHHDRNREDPNRNRGEKIVFGDCDGLKGVVIVVDNDVAAIGTSEDDAINFESVAIKADVVVVGVLVFEGSDIGITGESEDGVGRESEGDILAGIGVVDGAGDGTTIREGKIELRDVIHDEVALDRLIFHGEGDVAAVSAGFTPVGGLSAEKGAVVIGDFVVLESEVGVGVGDKDGRAGIGGNGGVLGSEGGGANRGIVGAGRLIKENAGALGGAGVGASISASQSGTVDRDGIGTFDDEAFGLLCGKSATGDGDA